MTRVFAWAVMLHASGKSREEFPDGMDVNSTLATSQLAAL
jgi:hypothetical protein